MAIIDLADNAQASALTSSMLGFVEGAPAGKGPQIYNFIFQPIRDADRLQGHFFLKRFLDGPQELWDGFVAKARTLPQIWNVLECPDDLLIYLKWMLGWTSEPQLEAVTSRLDALQLRRLLAASPTIWNELGPEDTWLSVIELLTATRTRYWNWFDLRWILDETGTSEERDGRDPWLLEDADERVVNVRIVDDGTGDIDRQLVRDVLGVMRPVGETIDITWLAFLDLFVEDGDDTQWVSSDDEAVIADGVLSLPDDTVNTRAALAVTALASGWTNLVSYARVRAIDVVSDASLFGMVFHSDGDVELANAWVVALDISNAEINLIKFVASAPTIVATTALAHPLFVETWYGIRVEAVDDGAGIRVFLDGDLVINETAVTGPETGTVGVFHEVNIAIECDEVEVMTLPVETDEVGPEV